MKTAAPLSSQSPLPRQDAPGKKHSQTEPAPPNVTRSKSAQDLIREAILDGHLKAGQKLIERELAEMTGVSRPILREGLANLEARGLIERKSYRGYWVVDISSRSVRDIYELRATVETFAAELFTERASDEEIEALRSAFQALEIEQKAGDVARVREAKEVYYKVLFTGCRNVEILKALTNVIDRVYYLRSKLMAKDERRRASMEEMRRLTEALANRDRQAARAACLHHIISARDAYLESMSAGLDPVPASSTPHSNEKSQ